MLRLNVVILLGNVVERPVMRHTGKEESYLEFKVAVDTHWNNRVTGRLEPHAVFIPVMLWGPRALTVGPALAKGMKVVVHGSLSMGQVPDNQGGHRRRIEIRASDVQAVYESGDHTKKSVVEPPLLMGLSPTPVDTHQTKGTERDEPEGSVALRDAGAGPVDSDG